MEKDSVEGLFEDYFLWNEDGTFNEKFNPKTIDEAYKFFKEIYNTSYGSIEEDDNLISIHTGGWSENEYIISVFKKTFWWHRYLRIERKGGHYFFDTDFYSDKEWEVIKK